MANHSLNCQHCKAAAQLYLCENCTVQLANMLDQIPWLIDELEARIQKLDRIGTGTIGRNRRPDELNVMDFDAAETARKVRKTLLHWVTTIAERHTGRKPPALNTAHTGTLARWLQTNTNAIARLNCAGNCYHDINKIVGSDQRGGQLINAINPIEKHSAGPCPTITGREHNGTPRQCGQMLFADTYDRTTDCPTCGQTIDVEKNRIKANADRDLHTKTSLLEVLNNIDETVTEEQLDLWIKARRLRPRGYIHDGAIVEFQMKDNGEAVYSVERARKLRRRDEGLRSRHRRSANA